MILKSEAIVLKTHDVRETSRLATFFTKNHGKLNGILKGIRADHRKFGSNLDKFSVNDIVYYYHSNSDVHLVSQCDLKSYFFPIRQDIKKTMAANYMLELVNILLPLEEENKDIYQLILDYLTGLEAATDIDKLVHILQIKILSLSGFRPHIDSCLVCDRQITDRSRFSLQKGGLVCSHCPLNEPQAPLITKGTVATLLHVERNNWERNLRLGFSTAVKRELKYLLNNFLVYHLGRPLKSEKYLYRK